MFTIIAIFLGLWLFPFMLGPALPFHIIKEEHRFIRKKIFISPIEKIFLWICSSLILILLFIYKYLPNLIVQSFLYIGVIIIIMLAFYVSKVGISLITQKDVSIFGIGLLTSRTIKIGTMLLIIIVALAVLENLHVIPTYLR